MLFGNKKTVLVVDDEESVVRLCQIQFEKWGINFIGTTNASKAVKFVEKKLPDLILLDMMLPGVSGLDICLDLNTNPKTKNIPVFFLTGQSNIKVVDKAYEAGARHYITKPIQWDRLKQKLEDILNIKIN